MKRRTAIRGGIVLLVLAVAGIIVWIRLAPPPTAQAQLERARKTEAGNAVRIAELQTAGDPNDLEAAARLRAEIVREYTAVKARFPGESAAVEDADYALLQINESETTSPEARLKLIESFLTDHTTSTRAADLRWKAVQIIDREVKKPLETIRVCEEYARDFPKDPRAAEALFRVGAIYEEVREFPRAVDAYRRVVKDYPNSPVADQAQFRIGTLLADKMEKKEEAAQEFEKMEKQFPKSRLAGAASGERRKLAAAAMKSESEQERDDYYGGVREVDYASRMAAAAETPQMQRIRAQQTDLVHQDVVMELSPADGRLTATVTLRIASRAAAPGTSDSLGMQLAPSLKVTTVTRQGEPATFKTEGGGYLFVDLGDRPISPDTTETFTLAYTGKNPESWIGEITSASTHLFNQSYIPLLNYGDNFTGDFRITVPEGYYASTQGENQTTTTADGRVTYHSRQTEPVWNHALAVAPYAVTEGVYLSRPASPGDTALTIPLTICLFPETTPSLAQRYLEDLPRIMAYYEERLGPYPYPKLVVAQVQSFPGGLGSPGLILIGPMGFLSADVPAQFLAHEVAHAWFGNLLTLDLSPGSIPWLSEGFAQYWDALYHEHRQGARSLARLMRTRAETYYEALAQVKDQPLSESRFSDPIYAPLTYEKGAFVLHGLRGVMGDEKFFLMMRQYVDTNRGRAVRMSDFQSAAESVHGESLDWFFAQWVDQPGMPRYRINHARQTVAGGDTQPFQIEVEVEQVGRPFRMPVELQVETKTGDPVRERLTIQDAFTTITLSTPAEPVKVVLDPDYRILKHPRREETEKAVTGTGTEN